MALRKGYVNIQISGELRDFLRYQAAIRNMVGEKMNISLLIQEAIMEKYTDEIKQYKRLVKEQIKNNNKSHKGGK